MKSRNHIPQSHSHPHTATCRDCGHEVSRQALLCPHCGAPKPAAAEWTGFGYEYKSRTTLFGLPLVHISFKYRGLFMPVPARGIIAIGQFGVGIITIAQFGVGVFTLAQFGLAAILVGQIGAAYYAVAQIAAVLGGGIGQFIHQVPLP